MVTRESIRRFHSVDDERGETATPPVPTHDSDPLVRPIGYVEDDPVIRRIGDRDCFLGNRHAADPTIHAANPTSHAADPTRHDRTFEFVLSATSEPFPTTTHHRPLRDGPGNTWKAFERAVDTTRELFTRDGSVLVHCNAGISRSATLLATAIAAEEGRQLRDALDVVQRARPLATPHPALHRSAVVYLAAYG